MLKRLASETSGVFGVAASPSHLRQFVLRLVTPRPTEQGGPAPSNALIRIGFPERKASGGAPSLCFGPTGGGQMRVGEARYTCPQCSASHTEVPTVCPICNLRLMSSVDLTKTYHHLFPLPAFAEVARPPPDDAGAPVAACRPLGDPLEGHPPRHHCFGCGGALPLAKEGAVGFECPRCREAFCAACDEFLHDTLHVCPGCQLPRPAASGGSGSTTGNR